jgi:hypothetical protein
MTFRPAGRFLAAALAGLFLSAPAPLAGADRARWVVVGKDGARTVLSAPPERKGDRYVGRLADSGALVSFAMAEVDEARTAEVNAAPRPVPTVATLKPVLGRTPVPSEEMKRVKASRQEAELTLAAASGTGSGGAAPSRVEVAPAAPLVDRNGHGEAWWRKRAEPIRGRSARAEGELTKAVANRDAWERTPGAGTPAWQVRLHRLGEAVAKAQGKADEAARQESKLAEEARKAGAYPGWIR